MRDRSFLIRTMATAFFAAVGCVGRMNAVWIETAQLARAGGAANEHFAWRVAIDGDVAVAVRPSLFGNAGLAVVYVRSAGVWTESAHLVPTFGTLDGFGEFGLAISDDTIAVGTQFGVSGSAAWVFVRPVGGWAGTVNESAILKNAGSPIAFAGTSIVTGSGQAPGANVFQRPVSGWSGTVSAAATLAPSDSPFAFGFSIAASGDTVIVGAPTTPVGGIPAAGKAYVFRKPGGGWTGTVPESAQLFASNPAIDVTFGWAVGIDGKTAVVTSNTKQNGFQEGEGYIFVEPGGGWSGKLTENARLDPSDVFIDSFGWSAAISGDTVIIGDTSGGTNDIPGPFGRAYVYQRPSNGWSGVLLESQELAGSSALSVFGWSVAISGNTILVGAPDETVGGNANQGQAHVFENRQLFVTLTRFLVEGPIRVTPGVPVQIRIKVETPQKAPFAPTGEIFVSDGEGHDCGTDISLTGDTQCQLTFGSPGTFVLRARYLGNASFRGSTSPALPVLVRAGGG